MTDIEKVTCLVSNEQIPITEAVELAPDKWVKTEYQDDYTICDRCWWLITKDDATEFNDEIYCRDCKDNELRYCDDCWGLEYIDDCEWVNDNVVCRSCYESNYFYCERCWGTFHNDDYWWDDMCYGCWDEMQDENDDWAEPKDWVIEYTDLSYWLDQKQTIWPMPQAVVDELAEFYWRGRFWLELSHRKTIEPIEFYVELDNSIAENLFNNWARWTGINATTRVIDALKYKRTKAINSSWVKVEYEYYNNLWKLTTKTESIHSVYEYYKRVLGDLMTTNMDDYHFTKTKYRCVLSNKTEHMLKLFRGNGSIWNSCQTSNNTKLYAKWAWDWFNNWCNVPVAVYDDEKLVGRMLCRLFYDNDMKEYLMPDRLYLSSNYATDKRKLIQGIVANLREHYDLVISANSEHDSTMYDYLYKNYKWEFDTSSCSLRQPARLNNSLERAYYHDSWTRTFGNSELMYDKIKQNNYYILPKK